MITNWLVGTCLFYWNDWFVWIDLKHLNTFLPIWPWSVLIHTAIKKNGECAPGTVGGHCLTILPDKNWRVGSCLMTYFLIWKFCSQLFNQLTLYNRSFWTTMHKLGMPRFKIRSFPYLLQILQYVHRMKSEINMENYSDNALFTLPRIWKLANNWL